jgi:hypothetical protein
MQFNCFDTVLFAAILSSGCVFGKMFEVDKIKLKLPVFNYYSVLY